MIHRMTSTRVWPYLFSLAVSLCLPLEPSDPLKRTRNDSLVWNERNSDDPRIRPPKKEVPYNNFFSLNFISIGLSWQLNSGVEWPFMKVN